MDTQLRTLHRCPLSRLVLLIISQTNRILQSLWTKLLSLLLVLLYPLIMKEIIRSHYRNNHKHSRSRNSNSNRNDSRWSMTPLRLPQNPVDKDRLFPVLPWLLEL